MTPMADIFARSIPPANFTRPVFLGSSRSIAPEFPAESSCVGVRYCCAPAPPEGSACGQPTAEARL